MLMYERGGVSVSLVSVRHVVEQGLEHAPYQYHCLALQLIDQ